MLHIKINLLRHDQLGSFISDGVINFMVPQLNDWYSYTAKLLPWQEGGYEYGRRQNRLATTIHLCF